MQIQLNSAWTIRDGGLAEAERLPDVVRVGSIPPGQIREGLGQKRDLNMAEGGKNQSAWYKAQVTVLLQVMPTWPTSKDSSDTNTLGNRQIDKRPFR